MEQHYNFQRERYGAAFAKMGLTVYTGKKKQHSSDAGDEKRCKCTDLGCCCFCSWSLSPLRLHRQQIGDGGFYHWLELPEGLNSKDFNDRLFKRGAAILTAFDCDMARPHDKSEVGSFVCLVFRRVAGVFLVVGLELASHSHSPATTSYLLFSQSFVAMQYTTPYERFFRFSFGPLLLETFESDIQLFTEVYEAYKKEMGM